MSFIDVPNEGVQALVPHHKVKSDNGRTTNLNIDPFMCEEVETEAGKTGPVRFAVVLAEVCPRDGTDCRMRADLYLLFLVTDNEAYAKWLRAGTGLDVTLVPEIGYEFTPGVGLAEYRFDVPAPAPTSFKVTGSVGAQRAAPVPIFQTEWFFQDTRAPDGKRRTATVGYEDHDDFFAPGEVTITAEKESRMAAIMGTTEAQPTLTVPHWIEQFVMVNTGNAGTAGEAPSS